MEYGREKTFGFILYRMYFYAVIKICPSKITGMVLKPSHMIVPSHPNAFWNVIKGLQGSFLMTSSPFPPWSWSSLQALHSPHHFTCREVQLQPNNIPIYSVRGQTKVHIMNFKGALGQKPKTESSYLVYFLHSLLRSLFHTFKDLVFRPNTIMVWLLRVPHKYWWHPIDKRWEGRPPTSQPLWSHRKHHRIQYWLRNGTPVEEFGEFQHSFKSFKSCYFN